MRIPICFAIGVLAAACSAGSPPPDWARIDRDVRAACAAAMPLAPLAGPAAPYIWAGCATEAGIAKLASDPSSVAWLNGMVAKIRR